jgi:hypothetical protein
MVSKTSLKALFNKVILFDPRKPGPMKPIVDVNNPGYYKQRAIEAVNSGDSVMAIRLLILSEAVKEEARGAKKANTTT